MKRIIFGALTAFGVGSVAFSAGAQTFSTPAYNGTGAPDNAYTNYQTSTNLSSNLGQNVGTSLGQNVSTPTAPRSPALNQPEPALGQPATAIGQQGTTAPGQQNTTAIGQQGTATAITPGGTTTAVTPSGTAVTPSGTVSSGLPGQSTNAIAGTITNGFIVNSDGTTTALPGAGSTAAGTFGGTNTGAGSSIFTPGQTNTFQTNTLQNP